MKLAILTATYNHPSNLKDLYKTLLMQTDNDFIWIIVDDGSNEDTWNVVNDMLLEDAINIYYERKNNGGKCSAINRGLDLCLDYDFVIIIDDDEHLCPEAVSIVKTYYYNYKDSDCGVINFARSDRKGMPILKMDCDIDCFLSVQELKKKRYYFDGYIGYFVNKLEKKRFPLFEGEKYIGPSVLIMLVCEQYTCLWTRVILGSTEYLAGGITRQGRRLRVNNPKGMIYHASLFMKEESGFYVRLGYSIRAYAYMYYSGLSKFDLKQVGIDMSVFYKVGLLGKILSFKWWIMYGK